MHVADHRFQAYGRAYRGLPGEAVHFGEQRVAAAAHCAARSLRWSSLHVPVEGQPVEGPEVRPLHPVPAARRVCGSPDNAWCRHQSRHSR